MARSREEGRKRIFLSKVPTFSDLSLLFYIIKEILCVGDDDGGRKEGRKEGMKEGMKGHHLHSASSSVRPSVRPSIEMPTLPGATAAPQFAVVSFRSCVIFLDLLAQRRTRACPSAPAPRQSP